MAISKLSIVIFCIVVAVLFAIQFFYIEDLKEDAEEHCITECQLHYMQCAEYRLKYGLKGFKVEYSCRRVQGILPLNISAIPTLNGGLQ